MTKTETVKSSPPEPQAVQRWRDLRFGMFIHWGPVTLRGTEIGINQSRSGITLTLPEPQRDESIMVIELTVEGQAFDITPVLG